MSVARARELQLRGRKALRDGQLQNAERSLREALVQWDEVEPQQPKERAYTMHILGICLSNVGKLVEAEDLLRESLDIKRTMCSDEKASIAVSELLFVLHTHTLKF
jgi:Flp pilus assembly protein TadD